MNRFALRLIRNTTLIALLCAIVPVQAAPPSESILPNTTRAFLTIADIRQLQKRWDQTQFGQMFNDPQMNGFAAEVSRFANPLWTEFSQTTETTLDKLASATGGPFTIALVESAPGNGEMVMLFETSEASGTVDKLLKEVEARFRSRGVRGDQRKSLVGQILVFDLPRQRGRRARQTVFFVTTHRTLGICASVAVAEAVLELDATEGEDRLAELPSFQDTMSRCNNESGEKEPDVRWFVDPVGCARLAVTADTRSRNVLDFMQKHGYDAIRGVGGSISISRHNDDVLLHTSIYAPQPYRQAMAMLRFPNGNGLSVPTWAPGEVSTLSTFYLDVMKAFDRYGGLFDELVADGVEGTFNEILKDIKHGTGVDVRKDLLAYLRPRVTIVGDVEPTKDSKSVHLAAIEIDPRHEKQIASAVRDLIKDDPDHTRTAIRGYANELWSIGQDSAIVADGHLFLSTDVALLRRMLQMPGSSLRENTDYRQVQQRLDSLGAKDAILRVYGRTDRECLETYEQLRRGKLGKSNTIYSRLITSVIKLCDRKTPRKSSVDFTKLPEFKNVKKYFGLVGVYGKNHPHGWLVVGFIAPRKLNDTPDNATK